MARKRKNGRGGPRMGAGRKAKPPEERRRNRVVIKLTDVELNTLDRATGDESLSAFIRRIVFRYLARRKK